MHLNVRPVYARVAKQNVASIRVLQKCGFTIDGEDTFTDIDSGVGEEFILALGAS
jgi:RimJ/RimL family protein N-acetyltransferase